MIIRLTIASWFAITLFACTYSFTGANTGNIKHVHIPVFDNLTPEPGIREKVTNRIITGIIDDNTFKVTDRKSADALLSGKITKIDDTPFAFEGGGNQFTTTDYKITVTTVIRFENVKDKKLIWEENISGWGRYSLSGSKTRNDGIDEAVRMIIENILNKVISNW